MSNESLTTPAAFVGPVLDAIEAQPQVVQDWLWAAIDRGELTYSVLADGRIQFSACGAAFLRLECVGVMPVTPDDGKTH
jgi:hypothetical protein